MLARLSNRVVRLALVLLIVLACLYTAQVTVGVPIEALGAFLDRWASMVARMLAVLVIAAYARSAGRSSTGWLLIAAGQACWAFGDSYFAIALWDADPMPFPSLADAGWVALYFPTLAGVVLLIRAHTAGHTEPISLLDAAIGALAISAAGAALAFGAIVDATGGSQLAIATNLAYPLGDLAVVAIMVAGLATAGWRFSRGWTVLMAGIALFAFSDTAYLFQSQTTPINVALSTPAGWSLRGHRARRSATLGSHTCPRPELECVRLSGGLRCDRTGGARLRPFPLCPRARARTCDVVCRGSDRADVADLPAEPPHDSQEHDRCVDRRPDRAWKPSPATRRPGCGAETEATLVLLDLDGFKVYNDTYGHPAGDALLARLGHRLAASAGDGVAAYRLGGDEFCVLAHDADRAQEHARTASAALCEHGDGFEITSSYGIATMPKDAHDAVEALRVADQRMYTQKHGRESSAGRQSKNVLLSALVERNPGLVHHLTDVAELAVDVARLLELPEHEIEQVRHAAELHDVGKVAIPDAILQKAGPLTDEEWRFVHEHTLIGARIISAAPALTHVAKLVRSSHERWDGTGYPDRLTANEIPIGSRIVSACDAFAAMITNRPYREAVDLPQALEELKRCAGTQFDPAVVTALTTVLTTPAALAAA